MAHERIEHLPFLDFSDSESSQDDEDDASEDGNESEAQYVAPFKKIPFAGFFIVLLQCLIMTLAAVFVKVLTNEDPFVITAYRNAIIFVCASIRLYHKKINPEPRGLRKYLFIRGCFIIISSSASFYSFRHLPLGDARTLTAVQPVFVTFFAFLFLGEPCGLFDIVALLISILGMTLITHPSFIFNSDDAPVHSTQYYLGALAAILSMLSFSVCMIITRVIKKVDFAVISAWNGLVSCLPPLLLSLAIGTFKLPSAENTLTIILIGVLSFAGQALGTLALQVEEAGPISLYRKTDDILVAFLIQMAYFQDYPDALKVIGSILIMSGVVLYAGRKIVEKSDKRLTFLRTFFCIPYQRKGDILYMKWSE